MLDVALATRPEGRVGFQPALDPPASNPPASNPPANDAKAREPKADAGPAGAGQAGGTVLPSVDRVVFDTALWWLLNKKDNAWKDHGLAAALKKNGLYDPDTIQLTAVNLPEPPPSTIALEDALKLTGDAKRGETASQRCLMCHRLGAAGVDFGPDLTTWGKTQPTEVILRSLIDPGADIAHGFHGSQIETTDGIDHPGPRHHRRRPAHHPKHGRPDPDRPESQAQIQDPHDPQPDAERHPAGPDRPGRRGCRRVPEAADHGERPTSLT